METYLKKCTCLVERLCGSRPHESKICQLDKACMDLNRHHMHGIKRLILIFKSKVLKEEMKITKCTTCKEIK
jgi:hypothetical protein